MVRNRKHIYSFPAKTARCMTRYRFKGSGKMRITGKTKGIGNRGDGFIRVEKEHLCFVYFSVSDILIESHPCLFTKNSGQILGRHRYSGGHFFQCNRRIEFLINILKTAFDLSLIHI